VSGFGSSHVFKTTDYGTTWNDIDNGLLPDVPASAVVVDPLEGDRWETFSRRLDNRVLTLAIDEGRLIDRETGTVWDAVRGLGLSGALAGESLGILPGFPIFPGDFDTFWPDGRLWQP